MNAYVLLQSACSLAVGVEARYDTDEALYPPTWFNQPMYIITATVCGNFRES